MLLNWKPLISCCAVFAISLGNKSVWTEVSFGKIPANQVSYSPNALHIKVQNSASPLVYRLPASKKVRGFSATLSLQGSLKGSFAKAVIEEDAVFRLGLVAEGPKKLEGFRKLLAPAWIKTLFALAPKDSGLDKIYFFNVGRDESQRGLKRIHPQSELMSEEVIAILAPGVQKFTVQHSLAAPLKTAGVWLSIDGDDSKSSYDLTVDDLTLETED